MPASAADFRKLLPLAAPLAIAFLALAGSRMPSHAAETHMLVIPSSDGYGFDDCLSGNKACGHVIADAWCEAHGMSSALSFGRAEDITASIASSGPVAVKSAKLDPGSFVVNCRD